MTHVARAAKGRKLDKELAKHLAKKIDPDVLLWRTLASICEELGNRAAERRIKRKSKR